jgi:hypothetical protein
MGAWLNMPLAALTVDGQVDAMKFRHHVACKKE